ncbi:YgfZ/GcvT domain-containing protein [Oceaniglobus ichthyenteri]|uniref:CAF17-like 4Fe-4S cluster assembly/insertion protein YgfZ n=1 Tax=Oceaniglobus ichthyenteri TaxID=2136177 RepID=UPI000D375096|nr:folate-binding protein YgfZ [Oceaniglobus ichthyenteri]
MSDDPRRILAISGDEAHDFLQGLVSNDVPRDPGVLRYAALLTPQGKYLCDFFMFVQEGTLHIDAPAALFDDLARRLMMYRLRRKIGLDEIDLPVARGTGPAPDGALTDPRHPALGWRGYGPGFSSDDTDYDALRVAHCIPAAGIELIANDTYLLEAGFERLNGIDFRKGCYVGQEINARMKHKTSLKKGLTTVAITGAAPVGTPITREGKPAGTLFTQSGDRAIAYLRFDRATGDLHADQATLIWDGEPPAI